MAETQGPPAPSSPGPGASHQTPQTTVRTNSGTKGSGATTSPKAVTPTQITTTVTSPGGGEDRPVSNTPSKSHGSLRGRRGGSELKLAGGRFSLKTKLGGGSFGEIFRATDTWRGKEVAVKLELLKTRHPQLNYESRIYKLLHHGSHVALGIPEIYWAGQEGEFTAMVMDMLGPCLEDLFSYCLRRFSLKTILMLADQMLHRIEFIHHKQFIHRDIKPENFVLGTGAKGHMVYILDFGLSKKFWDARTKSHLQYKEGKALTGTARYCSVNAHKGIEVSRRDDLESIGYLLLYFFKGSLPWQGLNAPDPQAKTNKIGEKKMTVPVEELCAGCPHQFEKYMSYVRNLKFEAEPDYEQCRSWFREVMMEHNYEYDWVFDWVVKRENEVRPADGEGSFASENPAFDDNSSRRSLGSDLVPVKSGPATTPDTTPASPLGGMT